MRKQCAMGRRILGTRTAHPYQPWMVRCLSEGREPLCRVRGFGSIMAQALKKVRRPWRGL